MSRLHDLSSRKAIVSNRDKGGYMTPKEPAVGLEYHGLDYCLKYFVKPPCLHHKGASIHPSTIRI